MKQRYIYYYVGFSGGKNKKTPDRISGVLSCDRKADAVSQADAI